MNAFEASGLAECAPARWIAPRLSSTVGTVATHVPNGYERYTRIFHPIDGHGEESTTWREAAQRSGAVMHPTAQFTALARRCPDSASHIGSPDVGNLAEAKLRALAGILQRHIITPDDCYLAFWEGYNAFERPSRITTYVDGVPHVHEVAPLARDRVTPPPIGRLTLPHRVYAVFRGSVHLADRFGSWISEDFLSVQSPNLIWPSDRAWFVATEVDFDSTLVGGNTALTTDLLSSSELETAEVRPSDELHSEADRLNA